VPLLSSPTFTIAVGQFMAVDRIDPGALSHVKERVVLLVRAADGDEEVKAAGRCVQGIVLAQDLPHLSHLGEALGGAV